MKYVGLLLHFYQPPTQDPDIVRKIHSECYLPLFRLLRDSGVRVTVNINYSLTEQLSALSLSGLEVISEAEGIEFSDSGAYHPILPLLEPSETARQLALNSMGNRKLLGSHFAPTGVFPPEMAFSPELARSLREMGYSWTITDDVPFIWTGQDTPATWIPRCEGIQVFLRSNFWSNLISFHGDDGRSTAEDLVNGLTDWAGEEDAYIVIAMDGETFGHHRKGTVETFLAPFLAELTSSRRAELVRLGDLPSLFPSRDTAIPSGSWSTTGNDLDSGNPYPLWMHNGNPDHTEMWKLLRIVLARARRCGSERVARMADRMLYSCPFWWASSDRTSPLQVRRGIRSILRTAFAVFEHTGDSAFIDRVMAITARIDAMTGEDDKDAQEGKNVCGQTCP